GASFVAGPIAGMPTEGTLRLRGSGPSLTVVSGSVSAATSDDGGSTWSPPMTMGEGIRTAVSCTEGGRRTVAWISFSSELLLRTWDGSAWGPVRTATSPVDTVSSPSVAQEG